MKDTLKQLVQNLRDHGGMMKTSNGHERLLRPGPDR